MQAGGPVWRLQASAAHPELQFPGLQEALGHPFRRASTPTAQVWSEGFPVETVSVFAFFVKEYHRSGSQSAYQDQSLQSAIPGSALCQRQVPFRGEIYRVRTPFLADPGFGFFLPSLATRLGKNPASVFPAPVGAINKTLWPDCDLASNSSWCSRGSQPWLSNQAEIRSGSFSGNFSPDEFV